MESALAVLETKTAVELFKPGAMDDVLTKIEAEVRSTPKDISTETGRKAIASLAYKVARSKTFIEDQRLALVSDEKKRLAAIDAEGKKMRDRLDALKLEARQPLTDYENAEKDRLAKHEANITAMELAGTLDFGVSIEDIQKRIDILESVDLTTFQEFTDRAKSTKDSVLSGLQTKLKITEKQEADRIEMERLQKEAADRAVRDREAQIAQEAREKAQKEAVDERLRIEQEKFAAESRAKQAEAEKAEAAAKAKQDAEDAAKRHAEATAAALKKSEDDAKAAVEAEKARVAAEAKKVEDEAKARERDKEHKAAINNAACVAVGKIPGVSAALAKAIVTAIIKGQVPAVKISY